MQKYTDLSVPDSVQPSQLVVSKSIFIKIMTDLSKAFAITYSLYTDLLQQHDKKYHRQQKTVNKYLSLYSDVKFTLSK